jgi:hypothetical protein
MLKQFIITIFNYNNNTNLSGILSINLGVILKKCDRLYKYITNILTLYLGIRGER